MSLINEKNYDIYDYKPSEIDEIISKKHFEFKDTIKFLQNKCPACESEQYNFAFDKYNFHYVQCEKCMSLYIQNRISEKDFIRYEKYLMKKIYSTDKYDQYSNALSEKISSELELTFSRLFSKNKTLDVAYLGKKSKVYKNILKDFSISFDTIEATQGLVKNKYDLIVIDHVIEKSNDLNLLMQNINASLKENGIIYTTMRVGSGIDILTLWGDSKVYPLEHNNLLSTDGIKFLLEKNNFIIKELNTPGVLDIDNILKTKSENKPKFLDYLNKLDNLKAIEEFQIFVQKNLLSSFATIIAQRG